MLMIKAVARAMDYIPSSSDKSARNLARRLGWFSVALGALQLAAPHRFARALDFRGGEPVIAAFGVREIATGVGLLAARDPAPFVWGRVAGDALDLVALANGFFDSRRRGVVLLALGSVAAVTAVDLICAQTLSADNKRRDDTPPDYADRTGLPKAVDQMRGVAAMNGQMPRGMRAVPWNAHAGEART
ncbi:cyclase dehydrase [Rhodomicrobium sp. Az07]|uniref:cyclase dehydrase n=1 Tax=Rhodomicrobium sp. Az07 TaxID=2839034 RepID=UPI001BE7D4B4|nr:cyclase dehydrase [Rhodomicrobium sp. Az07]MBT3069993.1 cyclase dehydrase [Rhodomicrobium sp. Az07]